MWKFGWIAGEVNVAAVRRLPRFIKEYLILWVAYCTMLYLVTAGNSINLNFLFLFFSSFLHFSSLEYSTQLYYSFYSFYSFYFFYIFLLLLLISTFHSQWKPSSDSSPLHALPWRVLAMIPASLDIKVSHPPSILLYGGNTSVQSWTSLTEHWKQS